MKIIHSNKEEKLELPFKLLLSFEDVLDYYKKYAEDSKHPYHKSAKYLVDEINKHPELINGFSDFSLLDTYSETIDLLLDPLFPEPLTQNEIKAVSIPFDFTSFKFTKRFENIINNAGPDFNLTLRNLDEDKIYIHACTMILTFYHKRPIDLRRPFFFDIPDKNTGITHHYRVAFNADFSKITPTENAPKITDEDFKMLLDNFENVAIWKEKFPPGSYIFKGFGIMNLFDVTIEETLSSLKANMLRKDDNLIEDVALNLQEFFRINDLKVGFSAFDLNRKEKTTTLVKRSDSLIISNTQEIKCDNFFCKSVLDTLFNKQKVLTISDVEAYGKASNQNEFYKNLKNNNIGSIILIPLKGEDNFFALLEIASPRPYELNSVNQNKLSDVIPVFEAAVQRASEEHKNILEAFIQEHYTAIHPSVKWRFYRAAENYFRKLQDGVESPPIEEIVFKNVYALYGQTDIKESSLKRNEAIKKDLRTQLNLLSKIFVEASKVESLPIYDEMNFRIKGYLDEVKQDLKTDAEQKILDLVNEEIHPVIVHIGQKNDKLKEMVENYFDCLHDNGFIYHYRRDYDESVTKINACLTKVLDAKQVEAQKMYPHFFERYKTDGVEHNMYIGSSIANTNDFNEIYLKNLRLWQLQTMCEMENEFYNLKPNLPLDLDVASMILAFSTPISIKYRLDEHHFDVDGTYNARYEIIKKRLDKAFIKGTKERVTQKGKIAIIYSQKKDEREYMRYIKLLQAKNFISEKVEIVDLETLQGVSGLKAIRVEVLYRKKGDPEEYYTYKELAKALKLQ